MKTLLTIIVLTILVNCKDKVEERHCYTCTTYVYTGPTESQSSKDYCDLTEAEAINIETAGSTVRTSQVNSAENVTITDCVMKP